jgi:hypothetical protein
MNFRAPSSITHRGTGLKVLSYVVGAVTKALKQIQNQTMDGA